jgi:uncharacterized protein (TIGR00369 family)
MDNFTDDQNCFVCGKKNAAGLQLVFRRDPAAGAAEAHVAFAARHQGWQDTVHGGLLATVLDEAMVQAAAAAGHKCITAEITVKYRKPAPIGAELTVSGRLKEARGRIVLAEARICHATGQVLSQAAGKLFKVE